MEVSVRRGVVASWWCGRNVVARTGTIGLRRFSELLEVLQDLDGVYLVGWSSITACLTTTTGNNSRYKVTAHMQRKWMRNVVHRYLLRGSMLCADSGACMKDDCAQFLSSTSHFSISVYKTNRLLNST